MVSYVMIVMVYIVLIYMYIKLFILLWCCCVNLLIYLFVIIIIMKLYFFLKSLDYVYNLFVLYVGYVWFFYLDVFKGLVFWELLFFW